ncbi:LANO_0H23178g1_1 [Lachancea nothofagi CBS 11611]|uniref:LANO_0H23178g1_1 n=1 Tax=Lachancea nothofagi CBS 11611 TaxID=1266666 RepID=A0A1G4KNS0_9SACH|nr:LANO_0H23178g1_1 [Lachancea nothofagi CBS 11611]
MEQVWQLLNYGWLFMSVVAQILRLGLCTLVVMLLGPLAALYVYDVGLYTWRVVRNRGYRLEPERARNQKIEEDSKSAEISDFEVISHNGSSNDTSSSSSSEINLAYNSDTEWDSITATSPVEPARERDETLLVASDAKSTPRFGGIKGSFTKFSDLITVTISAGASDTCKTEKYEHEVKLVTGRA